VVGDAAVCCTYMQCWLAEPGLLVWERNSLGQSLTITYD